MTKPTTRETFKTNCLRRLGFPVIEVNVDEDQVEDRVDEALDYYHQFHNEGTYQDYFYTLLDATDISNKYLSLDEDVIGVRRILPITGNSTGSGMFNLNYQIRLNDFQMRGGATSGVGGYVSLKQSIELMNQVFVGEAPIRFNRHMDRLFIDMDWDNDVSVGDYVLIDGFRITDPETYTDVYSDRMLQRYATALIKQQWGTNLKKYQGVQLIGGVEMNGQTIFDEAVQEIDKLEEQMRSIYELPAMFITG